MNDQNELSLEVSKTINATAEKLFDAWLDASALAKFMLPKPGMPNPAVTVDPRVGGRFNIDMDVGEQIIPHGGEYIEIDRPKRLSFTWESPFSADNSIVTIEFNETQPGSTEVILRHVKFLNEESRDNHNGGWSNILQELSRAT
jgi:uncharacterized protein YndB with AHSA1/START domain